MTPTGNFRGHVPLLLLGLGTGARLLPLALSFDFSGPDSESYLAPARSMAEGLGYLNGDGQPCGGRPPAYPLFLAGIFSTVGSPSLLAVRVVQAILGGVVALMVYAILTREGPRIALAGGILVALDPIAIGQSPFILREALLLLLVAALLLALTRLRGRSRALAGGAILAALALTHQLYMLLGGFLFLAEVARTGPRRMLGRRILPWVAMALLVFLAVFLWGRRNARITGRFSLTATQNAVPARELWLTSACPNAWLNGDPATGFQALAWEEERRLVDSLGMEGTKRELYRRAWENWRDHPARSLARLLRQNFWYWAEIPGAIRLVDHPILYVVRIGLLPFHWVRLCCALAGVWLLLTTGAWRRYRFALAILGFFALAPALLYPVPRYLGPGAPVLDLLAILGLWASLERRAEARTAAATGEEEPR